MRSAATRILEDVDRGILTADRGLYYSCNERIYACCKKKKKELGYFNRICVTLRGRIKEAARTLRKQDPALP